MRAVLYDKFGGPLRVERVDDPSPHADGAVMRVEATGLCRSDWHGWQGHDGDIQQLPHVPGHELAGVVEAVGSATTRVQVGDRVTMPFVAGCGKCLLCQQGNQQVCDHQFQPGFTAWGSFAEYVAVRYADENLVKLPESIDDVTAAGLGCRVATAYRAVKSQGRGRAGQWLAVFGCGGVGLSAVMIGRALDLRVIAIDVGPGPLELAKNFGAEHTLLADQSIDLPSAIRELTGGGSHISLDAVGNRHAARDAILSLRKRGRHVQVGLLAGSDADPPLPMGRVIGWELEIVGSHGLQAHAYPEMLELVTTGKLPIERLTGKTISLEETPGALCSMVDEPMAGMTIVRPQEK